MVHYGQGTQYKIFPMILNTDLYEATTLSNFCKDSKTRFHFYIEFSTMCVNLGLQSTKFIHISSTQSMSVWSTYIFIII